YPLKPQEAMVAKGLYRRTLSGAWVSPYLSDGLLRSSTRYPSALPASILPLSCCPVSGRTTMRGSAGPVSELTCGEVMQAHMGHVRPHLPPRIEHFAIGWR